ELKKDYDYIAINLGKTYTLALEKSKEVLDGHNVYWIDGQIGERLHKLKGWLNKISGGETAS
ncbi:MAG: peroxide stress protein YaaA, partial [Candidatus Helarchaeota archaeon]